jgi:hypothetical protein
MIACSTTYNQLFSVAAKAPPAPTFGWTAVAVFTLSMMQRSRCTSVTTYLPLSSLSAAGSAAAVGPAAASSTVYWNAGSPLSCMRSLAARAAVSESTAGRSAHLCSTHSSGKHVKHPRTIPNHVYEHAAAYARLHA